MNLRSLFHIYVYGSLHIAVSTVALVVYTYLAHDLAINWPYAFFVGLSTVLLYNLHRLIGLTKYNPEQATARHHIIAHHRTSLTALSIFSGLAAMFLFFSLDGKVQIRLILPVVISAAYVVPILANNRRIRDLPLVKVFMIAISYALITAYIPFGKTAQSIPMLLIGERAIFLLAITIPFDIRDRTQDSIDRVQSIPLVLGDRRAKVLALGLCMAGIAIVCSSDISEIAQAAMIGSYILAASFIWHSADDRDDLYYSFWMDGLMAAPLLLYLIFGWIVA